MALEQAAAEQPEVKSYDTELLDDTRAAFTEVASKTTDAPAEKPISVDEPVETRTATERARDEQGRFAKTEDKPADKPIEVKPVDPKPEDVKTQQQAAQTQPVVQPDKPQGHPPGEWEPKAKAQWDRLPQVVREAIGKSTAADPAVAELKPFIDRAKQSGQSLASALNAYTGMEALIRRDPAGGMMHVAQNLGLTQHQAGQLFLDLAQRLGVMPQGGQQLPAEGHDTQQEPDPFRALAPVLQPYQQRLDTLESVIRQQQEGLQAQRMNASMSAVEKFRSSPEARYFDNLERDIANILDKGIVPRTGDYLTDIKAAYDTACRMNPEISEILLTERMEKDRAKAEADARAAADKARNASRSVTGSPSSGNVSVARKATGKSYDDDLHNDVLDAVRQVSGRA